MGASIEQALKLDALKAIKDDPQNPFGSIVRQIVEFPGTVKERVTSALNIVSGESAEPDSGNIEGKWADWSRTISSQMLSKQSPALVHQQLSLTQELHQDNYESIKALTNPTVRKKMLEEFADTMDSSAAHLKAAAMPRQGSHVILPIRSMKSTEVYAPNYRPGERVVLIRHPHGGTFEIPELTVNNNNREGRRLLGDSKDAIGINSEVAKQLSGADFDGDTVVVIPNREGRIKADSILDELKNFDPIRSYPKYEGMKVLTGERKQSEMGRISNLITDMSILGAPHSEIARAIKHSMVVIDAENHELNYKQSYNDNNIKQLKQKYQTGRGRGASTLISRAGAEKQVPQRQKRRWSQGGPVNPKTGEIVWVPTGAKNKRTGKLITTTTTKLAETANAYTLISSTATPVERAYADYSNKLKAMANQARLDALKTPTSKQSPSAKRAYSKEVASLDAKLTLAKRNAPLERQANIIAAKELTAIRTHDPTMDKDRIKKVKYQLLTEARNRTGASKHKIKVTDDEWNAIQAGAIGSSKLNEILNNADMETIRKHATPNQYLMTPAKTDRAKTMLAQGYTRQEVADQLGVSLTTLDTATHA